MAAFHNYQEEARNEIIAADIGDPGAIKPDGRLHRFKGAGDKRNKNSWYICFENHQYDFLTLVAGSWKTDSKIKWCSKETDELSTIEWSEIAKANELARKKSEAELEKQYAEAAHIAGTIISEYITTSGTATHGYIQGKAVVVPGALIVAKEFEISVSYRDQPIRGFPGTLCIPAYNESDEIQSLQFIYKNRDTDQWIKRWLAGSCTTNARLVIGNPVNRKPIMLAEGSTTAASGVTAVAVSCIVAFNAGNLLPVAKSLRKKYPKSPLLILGDDDVWTDGNPGRRAAEAIARELGNTIAVFPDFCNYFAPDEWSKFTPENKGPSDFNDLQAHGGVDAVRNQLTDVLDKLNEIKPDIDEIDIVAAAIEALPTDSKALFADGVLSALIDLESNNPEMYGVRMQQVKDAKPEGLTLSDINKAISGKKRKLKADQRKRRINAHGAGAPYTIENGSICWLKETQDGSVSVPLCNFNALITEAVTHDDGIESKVSFHIEGECATGSLPATEVPSATFASLNWLHAAWGNKAIVNAGFSNKDHLRCAIQVMSGDVPSRVGLRVHGMD